MLCLVVLYKLPNVESKTIKKNSSLILSRRRNSMGFNSSIDMLVNKVDGKG